MTAKKNKPQKKSSKPVKPSIKTVKLISSKTNTTASLIVFDRKVKIFLMLLLVMYFGMSFFALHTSSIANWDKVVGPSESESVLAGTPRYIRMDEWMTSTPALVGQVQNGLPLSNAAFGDGNAPLILGYPVKDLSMLLRPNLWPYFIFDVERAFAFSWNFNIFFSIISTFLLFMLLTKNNFWISVFGAFFIFLSGAMQWWSYTLGSNMIYLNGIIISFIYLLYGKNVKTLIFAGVILLFSSFSFLNGLYPPWQVPLVYLYMAILVGFLMKKKDLKSFKEKLWLRIGILCLTSIVLFIFLYHYYSLVKPTFDMMLNTAYPGKRTTNGGDLVEGKLFSDFFGMYLSDDHFPRKWLNICEASSLIMFFPIIFYGMGYNYIKLRKFDWLQIMIALYSVILLIWLLVGFPTFLSKISLLSMSPTYRTLPVFGVVNGILLICYLGNKEKDKQTNFYWLEFIILVIAVSIFIRSVGGHINKTTSDFFSSEQVTKMTILISTVYLLIRYKYLKYTQLVLALLLLGMNISNIAVNPLTQGLSALLENPLNKSSREIYKKDPKARWAVFGDGNWANLLKSNGINIFNGAKFTPILKDMAVFDSSGKYRAIYNRYAHVEMKMYINWKDTVVLNQPFSDGFTIFMDPCSPRLQKLGIKYLVFTYKPQEPEVRCMTRLDSTFFIYKRKEE